ncbi:MAG TPA: hypothetical protein PLI22_07650 [Caldisericia bacterium]|nr:hypothetical protein [Caldisericia bacterium]
MALIQEQPAGAATTNLSNENIEGISQVDQQIMQGAMAQQGMMPPISQFENL